MDKVYSQNPEVLAYFAMVNGKLVFDFDEHKIPPEHIMLVLHQTVEEYLKVLANSSSNVKEK